MVKVGEVEISDRVKLNRSDLETKSVASRVVTRVVQAQSKVQLQSTIVIVAAVLVSVLTTCTIILTRPAHVAHPAAMGPTLVDSNGQIIGTQPVQASISIEKVCEMGEDFDYNSIESVSTKVYNNATGETSVMGFRTIGFHWYNNTDIDFFLQGAMTLHVSNGIKVLAPTVRDAFGMTPSGHRRSMLLVFALVCLTVQVVAIGAGAAYYYANRE